MNRQFKRQYQHLGDLDPVFAHLVDEYGHPDPFEWHDGGRAGSSRFAAMMLHIVGQQISATVAFVVFGRIAAATGGVPTPKSVLAHGLPRRRRGDRRTHHGARRRRVVRAGVPHPPTPPPRRPAGRRHWHPPRHPRRLELDDLPTVDEVQQTAAAWAPYRTYAAALLWRSRQPVSELSDPKARALSREATGKRPQKPSRPRR
jgi:DNA-3-methyladenine glycosylase II